MANPFEAPPETPSYPGAPVGYAPGYGGAVQGGAARPASVPAFPAFDPWQVAGWVSRGGAGLQRTAAIVLVLLLPVLPVLLGMWVEDLHWARYEKERYVVATGYVDAGGIGDGVLAVSSPETGKVDVVVTDGELVYEGDGVKVLLARDDPSDYLLWDDRAMPWVFFAVFAVGTAIAAAAALVLALAYRRRRSYVASVREVALTLDDTGPPPPLPPGLPLAGGAGTVLWLVAAAVLVAATLGLALTVPGLPENPEPVRTEGRVVSGERGLAVRFFDRRIDGEWERPLSQVEARGRSAGDTMPVSYVIDPWWETSAHDRGMQAGYAVLFALLSTWVTGRAVHRAASRARLRGAPAQPYDVVAWTRVVGSKPWLVVMPAGSDRLRDAVAVPLTGDTPLPAAFAGRLWVHGHLRPGDWVVARSPDGGVLRPAAPVRGALWATLRADAAVAPLPPVFVAYGWGSAGGRF
ncbi:MAG TPA: hypothetical protein VF519_10200 [Mycobacteriales bacterium]